MNEIIEAGAKAIDCHHEYVGNLYQEFNRRSAVACFEAMLTAIPEEQLRIIISRGVFGTDPEGKIVDVGPMDLCKHLIAAIKENTDERAQRS